MLILSRQVEEPIWLGDEIAVTVLGVKGGVVKLGIDAPRDVAVNRSAVIALSKRQFAGNFFIFNALKIGNNHD